MTRKEKLLEKLRTKSRGFTWDEAVTLMHQCNFTLLKTTGSRRVFRHASGAKVFIHEPHPQNILLPYAMDDLIEGLKATGEIS